MERRKGKNSEKSPWGQCLTRPVPNGRCRSGFWLVPENLCFSGTNQKPEQRQLFGLVRHCPQGLFSPFFTFLHGTFFRPFRLSLVPTIYPWVSEDVAQGAKEFFLCSWWLNSFPRRFFLNNQVFHLPTRNFIIFSTILTEYLKFINNRSLHHFKERLWLKMDYDQWWTHLHKENKVIIKPLSLSI